MTSANGGDGTAQMKGYNPVSTDKTGKEEVNNGSRRRKLDFGCFFYKVVFWFSPFLFFINLGVFFSTFGIFGGS